MIIRRLSLLAATICLIAMNSHAQTEFGIKAGLNLTNIKTDMPAGNYQIKSSSGSKLGYHAGGFIRASLFGIYIQPELLFTSIASEYSVTNPTTTLDTLAKQRIGRIDIPLLIGARLGNLRLGVGPVGSIIVSDKNDLSDLPGFETEIKTATIGYQVGVGLDIRKFGLDLRYEGNLSQLGDRIVVGGQSFDFDSRAKQVIFSLSYRF